MHMPVKSAMSVAACNALKAALLLTGNAASAESATLQAVSSLEAENVTAKALLHRTIEISLRDPGNRKAASDEPEVDWPDLPVELRNVLQMRASLRHCFVLRVLLGLPKEVCARLLQLDGDKVTAKVSAAMNWLAAQRKTDLELTRGIEFHREVGQQDAALAATYN
jgi:hypothetical protein